MKPRHMFRMLLILTIAFEVSGACAYVLESKNLPPELQSYVDISHQRIVSSHYVEFVSISAAFVLLSIFSFFGLYVVWRPARILYLALISIIIFSYPFFGPDVTPTWTGVFWYCDNLLLGIICYMIFTSPVRKLFSKTLMKT